jgi:TPR repeat protein
MLSDSSFSSRLNMYKEIFKVSMLITKAKAGDSAAQYEIACILASGQLGVINHKVSFHWFMKAALKGHIEAMWNAGLQLVLGLGVDMAADAGLHLIDLAASRNCYDAICYLAHTYHLGLHGVSIDREKSGHLYRLAECTEPWHQEPHPNLNQQQLSETVQNGDGTGHGRGPGQYADGFRLTLLLGF